MGKALCNRSAILYARKATSASTKSAWRSAAKTKPVASRSAPTCKQPEPIAENVTTSAAKTNIAMSANASALVAKPIAAVYVSMWTRTKPTVANAAMSASASRPVPTVHASVLRSKKHAMVPASSSAPMSRIAAPATIHASPGKSAHRENASPAPQANRFARTHALI